MALSTDGKILVVGETADEIHSDKFRRELHLGRVRGIELSSGETLFTIDRQAGEISTVAYLSDRKLLAYGSSLQGFIFDASNSTWLFGKTIRVWDIGQQKELRTFVVEKGPVNQVFFSPDGTLLAAASGNEFVQTWDVDSGDELAQLDGQNASITSIAFSADGKLFASAGTDGIALVWDLKDLRARPR